MQMGVDVDYIALTEFLESRDFGDNGVIVALLDTGVDFSHDGLKNAMWIPPDQKNNSNYNGNYTVNLTSHTVSPAYSESKLDPHGTGCAGVIASQFNGDGVAGIASGRNVKIMSVNITNDSENFTSAQTLDLISAIRFAEENGAKVCNISFSTKDYNKELEETIRSSNMLFVVSAGNGEPLGYSIDSNKIYPASLNLDNVITVANLSYSGKLHRSSNFGKDSVDIAAPGTCIYTTAEENTYQFRSGTSIASPMVSAVAAVVYSLDSTISAVEVKDIILKCSDYYASLDGKVGSSGCLNAYKAVKYKAEE